MDLTLIRDTFTPKSTTGRLLINHEFECFTLEDATRESVPGLWKPSLKIPGKTAIPYGKYEVALTYSARFARMLPLLLAVPDYSGVRIHAGNSSEDTEGCILVGFDRSPDWVGHSKVALEDVLRRLKGEAPFQKIWLEVQQHVV